MDKRKQKPIPPKSLKEVKKARARAKAERLGTLEAEREHDDKLLEKHPLSYIKKLLQDHAKEIPEWVALVGVTVVVKTTIDATENLRSRANIIVRSKGKAWPLLPTIAFGKPVKDYEGMFPDWMDWIIAFSIAYVLVHHAGAIFGMLGNAFNMVSVIGLLLGV